jgi:hypothetical protein
MNDQGIHMKRGGLVEKVVLGLGLLGLLAGWEGALANSALAQKHEELFTPYLIASAAIPSIPSGDFPITSPRGESDVLKETKSSPSSGLLGTAVRLVKRGQYGSAIVLLEPYKTRDDFLTLHALGVAYVRTERNGEAYETLLRAHKLNPSVPGPLLPAALACARMARQCDEYRQLALNYIALGGKFTKFADRIAHHVPFTIVLRKRS